MGLAQGCLDVQPLVLVFIAMLESRELCAAKRLGELGDIPLTRGAGQGLLLRGNEGSCGDRCGSRAGGKFTRGLLRLNGPRRRQGRGEFRIVIDDAEIHAELADDELQLLKRLAGRAHPDLLAMSTEIAVLSDGMHGRNQGLVVDALHETRVTHHLEERWGGAHGSVYRTIDKSDDELKRRASRATALRRSDGNKDLSGLASPVKRRQLGELLEEIEVHGYL